MLHSTVQGFIGVIGIFTYLAAIVVSAMYRIKEEHERAPSLGAFLAGWFERGTVRAFATKTFRPLPMVRPLPYRAEKSRRFIMSSPRRLGDLDVYLFKQGRHTRLYEFFGAHPESLGPECGGTSFVVWAPNASYVSVVGDFNNWDRTAALESAAGQFRGVGGLRAWGPVANGTSTSFPGPADRPSAPIPSPSSAKASGHGFHHLGSAVRLVRRGLDGDQGRAQRPDQSLGHLREVHLGSWRRDEEGNFSNYRQMAHELTAYAKDAGFTHVELMPVAEHPFLRLLGISEHRLFRPDQSLWRSPQDFRYFVDYLHQQGLGVILDWVPGHFPMDAHGLAMFDGTALFEHADPRPGLSSGMEERHLQLWPLRSRRIPDLQRHVLDA